MLLAVVPVTRKFAGADGGVASGGPCVVPVTVAPAETLPDASLAFTVNLLVNFDGRFPTVKFVSVGVRTWSAQVRMYPATPTLSVDGSQASEMLLEVVAVTLKFAGVVGG